VLENRLDRVVTVTLLRDLSVYAGDMVVEYATSDLTARGVDEAQYQACLGISPGLRAAAGCGDYLHTSGVVVIPADATSGGFTVSIVDDLCRERFMEYIQVRMRYIAAVEQSFLALICLHGHVPSFRLTGFAFTTVLQVTISVPGSAALQGERLSAKIRIDDNDYDRTDDFC
jgi:hypothetical protein